MRGAAGFVVAKTLKLSPGEFVKANEKAPLGSLAGWMRIMGAGVGTWPEATVAAYTPALGKPNWGALVGMPL